MIHFRGKDLEIPLAEGTTGKYALVLKSWLKNIMYGEDSRSNMSGVWWLKKSISISNCRFCFCMVSKVVLAFETLGMARMGRRGGKEKGFQQGGHKAINVVILGPFLVVSCQTVLLNLHVNKSAE